MEFPILFELFDRFDMDADLMVPHAKHPYEGSLLNIEIVGWHTRQFLDRSNDQRLQSLSAEIENFLKMYPTREQLDAFVEDCINKDVLAWGIHQGGIDFPEFLKDLKHVIDLKFLKSDR